MSNITSLNGHFGYDGIFTRTPNLYYCFWLTLRKTQKQNNFFYFKPIVMSTFAFNPPAQWCLSLGHRVTLEDSKEEP